MQKHINKFKDTYLYKLMRYIYKTFFFSNPIFFFLCISLALNFLTLILVSIKGSPDEIKIPLHYTITSGIDKTGYWYEIYYLPAIALLFNLFSFLLSWMIYKKGQEAVAYILMSAMLLFNLFCLFASYLLAFKI